MSIIRPLVRDSAREIQRDTSSGIDLGPELIVSYPDFVSGEWTLVNPPWVIGGGDLITVGSAVTGFCYSNVALVNGSTYRVGITVTVHTQGTIQLYAGATAGITINQQGFFTQDIVYTTDVTRVGVAVFNVADVTSISCTGISVREVL